MIVEIPSKIEELISPMFVLAIFLELIQLYDIIFINKVFNLWLFSEDGWAQVIYAIFGVHQF